MAQEVQLSRNIIALRKEKGWTQEYFAEKVGVTRTAVTKWETGSCMDIYKLVTIAEVFGVTLDELVFDKKKIEEDEPEQDIKEALIIEIKEQIQQLNDRLNEKDIYKYYEDNANEFNVIDDSDGIQADMVYDAGVEAAEKGDYSSAIRLMEEALMRGMYQATGALMQVYSEMLDIYSDQENMVGYTRTYLTVAKKMQEYGKICEKILMGRK